MLVIDRLYEELKSSNFLVDIDSRKIRKGSIFFGIKGNNFNGNEFIKDALRNGSRLAITDDENPNFSDNHNVIKVSNSLTTLQELSKFHRKKCNAKVIGITGSNGKTTTKELIYSVISSNFKTICTPGNFNNHIGLPLSLFEIRHDTEFAIIEMGANNFGEIAFLTSLCEPDYGYITNFGKAHLEGFIDIDGVIKAKTELYEWIIKNDKTLLINGEDKNQKKFDNHKHIIFGHSENFHFCFRENNNDFVNVGLGDYLFETKLYGTYNYSNVCAAIALGLEFGIDKNQINQSLKSYKPKNNRSEIIKIGGKTIVLDAYNANPSSVEEAIKSFSILEGDKAIILGDMYELGEESSIEHKKIIKLCEDNIDSKCIFIGEEFYNFSNNEQNSNFFKNKSDFFNSNMEIDEKNILIKGSRGMKMEEILKYIQ
mgnify:FL=1